MPRNSPRPNLRSASKPRESASKGNALSAKDRAYQALKTDILTNRLHPGDPIPVEKYVRELRLSRTPVREAALQLQREGLIDIHPRLGTFVSYLDLGKIRDFYRVRRLLEGEAAREAALRAPREALEQLRHDLAAFSTAGEIDAPGMSEVGKQVHQIIVQHCGNDVLRSMILSLQDHFTLFRSLSVQLPEKVLSSHREHLEIVDSLIARDGARAAELIHQHFDHAGQFLLHNLLHGSLGGAPRVKVGS